jgi:VWFA-related protein
MKKRHRPLALVLLAVVALPALAAAQKEPAGEFGELIEVTEVFLDVLATDKKGDVVPGLGIDDFVVLEDGEPVPLTSVSFYTTRYAGDGSPAKDAPAPAGAAVEIPSSRYFILFFHDQTLDASPQNRLLQQQRQAASKAHEWVRDYRSGSDWVAVLSYDVKLHVNQDFTQDTASLVKAISDASISKAPEALKPSERDRMTAGTEPSLWRGLPDAADLGRETTRIYDALRLVGEATRPIVGRKNLLLFTVGFGELEFAGTTRPDPRFYPDMEETLNHSNVAVYPIDLTPAGFDHAQSDFLSRLAYDTGGYYHQNIVSYLTPLLEIGDENTGYYLLSFRTEHPAGESGYREIKVKAKDKSVRVRTRRGYRYGVEG